MTDAFIDCWGREVSKFLTEDELVEQGHTPGSKVRRQYYVEVHPGAKCKRCWKHDILVGVNYSWPDLCPRCAEVLDELRANDPDHPDWGVNGAWEKYHAQHPIRQLALDPTVRKHIKNGRIIEVWGTEDQMPWRFREDYVAAMHAKNLPLTSEHKDAPDEASK